MYVLLHPACCCCSSVAVSSSSPISSLRDRYSLRTAARPSPCCRKPLPSIRTSARGASNRFRRSLLISTPILHSHRLRRTSRNGGRLWPAVPRKDGAGSTTMSRQRHQRRSSDFIYRERERERETNFNHLHMHTGLTSSTPSFNIIPWRVHVVALRRMSRPFFK